MADEPEPLGERLRRIERDLWAAQIDIKHARASEALFDDMVEHVLMPAILLLAGHGHREQLADMLARASEAHATRGHLDDQLREGSVEWLQGWKGWLVDQPRWVSPAPIYRQEAGPSSSE